MHCGCLDGNEGPDNERYGLRLNENVEDLAKVPGGRQEGLHVIIHMIGEIGMEAALEWDIRWNGWTGRPAAGTCKPDNERWGA